MEKFLNRIDGFGKYQKFLLFLLGLISLLKAMTNHSVVFSTALPVLECRDLSDNRTLQAEQSCRVWKNSSYVCQFSTEYYGNTIITEWSLACENLYKASFIHTVFMIGSILSFFGGVISDKFGRKKALILSCVFLAGTISTSEIMIQKLNFSVNTQYIIYVISQAFVGAFSNAMYVVVYVLIIEITSVNKNTTVTVFANATNVLGMLTLMIVAYLTRDWHETNTFVAILSVIVLILTTAFLPESPRFLIGKKKYEECFKVLRRFAFVNGRSDKMPSKEDFLKQVAYAYEGSQNNQIVDKIVSDANINFQEIQSLLSIKIKPKRVRTVSQTSSIHKSEMLEIDVDESLTQKNYNNNSVIFFLMNPVSNLFKTIALVYVWIVLSMIYYGVTFGITSLSRELNPYFMYFLSAAAELIGYSACLISSKQIRVQFLILLVLSGTACLLTAFIPADEPGTQSWRMYLLIISASSGKALVSACWTVIYVYTIRMFPTNIRNTMLAVCTSMGRIGSMISPQINMLRHMLWAPLPYIIFSSNAAVASFIVSVLPDPDILNFK